MGLKSGESKWEREKEEREEKRNNERGERNFGELKRRENVLKNYYRTYHSATVSLYIYDGTIALCQKNLHFFMFTLPNAESYWA